MNSRNERINEPLDNVIPRTYPSLLSNAITLLIDNEVFTKASLIQEFANHGISMNSDELEKLLSLQKGYLSDKESGNINPFILKIK